MASPAIAGSPAGMIPSGNVCEWVFSNPFEASSEVMKHAPSARARAHHVPKVPLEKPIFVDAVSGALLGWSRLRKDALRVAAGLHALGLRPNPPSNAGSTKKTPRPSISPVVLIHLPNCLPFAPLLLGTFAAGLVATMASSALTAEELAWIVNSSKPSVVITSTEAWPTMAKALETQSDLSLQRLSKNGRVFLVDSAHDDYGLAPPSLSASSKPDDWKHLLSSRPLAEPIKFTDEDCRARTAVILWSSGTSGKSKGVVLSHHALNASLLALWHINLGYHANEKWLGLVPFFHVFGLLNVLLLSPCCGATTVVLPKFAPESFLSSVQEYRITCLHMAPPLAVMLAKSPMVDDFDFSSVEKAVSGGAPLSWDVIEMVDKRLGVFVRMGYGLSEATSVCNQLDGTWQERYDQRGNTGVPLYGVELKIVPVDDPKKTLSIGEEGEILIRSPSIMSCYLNNEQATRDSLTDDGWFRTGDIGKIDSKGHLWITDRMKEIIKVKSFQVSPSDLETVLCRSPLVADAGVSSMYDAEQATEFPRAYIVPADQNLQQQISSGSPPISELEHVGREVKKWVEERSANYKWIRGNIVFVSAIPKSPSGKILRRLLKDTKGFEIKIYQEKQRAMRSNL